MSDFALITGASMGLGRAFALELAAQGYNLLLVSLPGEHVEQVGATCRERGVQCHIFETDLTCKENILKLADWVNANYQLSILINNAGVGGSRVFKTSSLDYVNTILQLNIAAPTLLIHQLLGNLQRAQQAYVLNISSMACFTPSGFKTVYPASKNFIRHFSQGLNQELRGSSVSVSVAILGPMPTQQDITRRIEAQGFIGRVLTFSPQEVARLCLKKMFAKRAVFIVGWSNKLSSVLLRMMPTAIRSRVMTNAVKKEIE